MYRMGWLLLILLLIPIAMPVGLLVAGSQSLIKALFC
jgi:hypothetical protein